jgi:hypothetical protein
MKTLLLSIICVLPFIISAQSYNAININFNYGISHENSHWLGSEKALNGGVGIEKYFKSGIKLSAGVNYNYGYFAKQKETTVNTQPSHPVVYYDFSWNNIQIPVTIGYNVLNKNSNLQLFPFIGYSRFQYFSTKLSYYDASKKNKTSETVNNESFGRNNLVYGLDIRYVIAQKYFFGLNTTMSYWFNRQVSSTPTNQTVGIKIGVLF